MSTSSGAVASTSRPAGSGRGSAVASTLAVVGWAVAALGAVVSILGLAGVSAFDVSIRSFAFDSTSTGLMVVALGAGLAAGAADDRAAAVGSTSAGSRWSPGGRSTTLAAVSVMSLGLLLFIVSILF